jgi:hypothetical protein
MVSPNTSAMTRELWVGGVKSQVEQRLILLAALEARNQIQFKAGTAYKKTVQSANMDDLVQEYDAGANVPLSGGSKTISTTVQWYRKNMQLPLIISRADIAAQQGGGDAVIEELEPMLVKAAQKAMRIHLAKALYRPGSSTRDGNGDGGFQGLNDALTHDITYGGLTRATTVTNKFWQGASVLNTFADQAVAMTPTLENVRKCVDAVRQYAASDEDLLVITSLTNWRSIQSQVEASATVKPGKMMEFGFSSLMLDNSVEVVAEPWLTSGNNTLSATQAKYLYVLHLPDWKLMFSPDRNLKTFTGFKWQGDVPNGLDAYMGRILPEGNLICEAPNQSLFRSNVSM